MSTAGAGQRDYGLRRRDRPGREAWCVLDTDFVLDAAARERLTDRFGAGAGPWCDALPGLVDSYCQRWGLELDEALSGGTSRVFIDAGRRPRDGAQADAGPVGGGDRGAGAARMGGHPARRQISSMPTPRRAPCSWRRWSPGPGSPTSRVCRPSPKSPGCSPVCGLRTQITMASCAPKPSGWSFSSRLIGQRLSHPRVRPLVTPDLAERGHRLAAEPAAGGIPGWCTADLGPPNVLTAGPDHWSSSIPGRPSATAPPMRLTGR